MKRKPASSQPTTIAEPDNEEKEPKRKPEPGQELYEVEEILAHCFKNGELLYETKWIGYDETTWEPREAFNGSDSLITDYEKKTVESKKRGGSSRSKSRTKTSTQRTKDEKDDSRARSTTKRKAASNKETSRKSSLKPKAGSRARSTKKMKAAVEQEVPSREASNSPVPKRCKVVQDDELEPAIRYFSSKRKEATSDDGDFENLAKEQEDFTIDLIDLIDLIDSESSEQLENHDKLQCYATLMYFKRSI